MLTYQVIELDEEGMYGIAYPTPGAPQVMTVASKGPNRAAAERECARLNELQIVERRAAIRDKADRIVDDLPRNIKGEPDVR